jgi:2-keto-3-deoxy-L-rhamnonate aldolase RhmA
VVVSMVGTADEARQIVACTRYPPLGRRGAAFGFPHDDYQGGDVGEKMGALHERTMVIPQIETADGLANVEAIAAVPGVDALWLGQFDLSNFLGIPGQFKHPTFLSAVDRIVAACEAHGKTAALIAMDDEWAREYAVKGFRLFAYGVDSLMLQSALAHGLELLRATWHARG